MAQLIIPESIQKPQKEVALHILQDIQISRTYCEYPRPIFPHFSVVNENRDRDIRGISSAKPLVTALRMFFFPMSTVSWLHQLARAFTALHQAPHGLEQ